MSNEQEELNLPWTDEAGNRLNDNLGTPVCNTCGICLAEQRQKAKFIKTACNAHYDLLAALDPHGLEEVALYIEREFGATVTANDLRNLATKQRAAIEKAMGETK